MTEWTPVAEMEWKDAAFYWLRAAHRGKPEVVRAECSSLPFRGPDGASRPLIVSVRLRSTNGAAVLAPAGSLLHGPLNPPAWPEGA